MSNVKILVALLAACILVMPAFSMPDDGNPTVGQNSKAVNCPTPMMDNKAPAQQPCPCMNPIAGQDGKVPAGQDGKAVDGPTPMMDNKAPAQQPCPCMNPIAGQDGKALAGQDGKAVDGPKSMMRNDDTKIVCLTTCKVIGQDGQQIPSIGPNGEDDKQILSMMGDGAQNPQGCPCQKPLIGPNGDDGKQKIRNDQNSKPDELEQDNQD
ncbi:MAG: hypothetical protein ABR985_21365 [Methanotrichaceae archaeon]|jgi:hypothetical protein